MLDRRGTDSPLETLYTVAAVRPTWATALWPSSRAVFASVPSVGRGLKPSAKVSNISRSQPPSPKLWYTAFQPADETRPPKKALVKFQPQLLLFAGLLFSHR